MPLTLSSLTCCRCGMNGKKWGLKEGSCPGSRNRLSIDPRGVTLATIPRGRSAAGAGSGPLPRLGLSGHARGEAGRATLARSKVGIDLTNSACWILLYLLR